MISNHCTCSLFISGVGGTGKSFLIKAIRALVLDMWHDKEESLLCAVTAPTGLAAFNVGGVNLPQTAAAHEGRTAGYWRLGKDPLKVMRRSLSQLRLLIIDEVSMLSNLNLAYVHLRLDEIFGRDEWFGGVNVLFVGDILQLPPVNGAPVFDRITNKAVASKLGCNLQYLGVIQPKVQVVALQRSEDLRIKFMANVSAFEPEIFMLIDDTGTDR